MWCKSELKLQWFDKLLMTVVGVWGCLLMMSPGSGVDKKCASPLGLILKAELRTPVPTLWPLPFPLLADLDFDL